MTLEIIIFSKKKQVLFSVAFFLFVYLLPILINERSHNTLLVITEGAIKHNLRSKIWL